jgi:phage gp36-like protein
MPAYAVQQDLVDRYGLDAVTAASDRTGTGSPDATLVGRALDDATGEINGWIQQLYLLPLTTVPPVLVKICCDLAMYSMATPGGAMTTDKRQRYEDALSQLKSISRGDMKLGIAPVPAARLDSIFVASGPRQFTRRSQRGDE